MNKKEFFAAVNLYKRQSEVTQWKNDFLPKAIAASAKEILAHSTGHDDDALAFANELTGYTNKLDWMPDSEFAKISSMIEHSAEELVAKYSGVLEEDGLEHGEWKKHKYIRIENGRYIYPEDLKKSAYKEIQTSKEEAQKKMDYIEGHQYVIPIKKGQTNVLTGKVATKEDADNAPKTGLANLDLGKRVTEKKHDMTLAGDNQGQPTSLYVKNKYYADGVTKTANELQKQINKADLDKKNLDELHKNAEDLVQKNEDRKERNYQAVGKAGEEARSRSDSAAKAQSEGEAMQKWKNQQAAKKGEGESYEKAKREGEAMQAWKNAQAQKETLKNQTGSNNAKNAAQSEGEAQQKWKELKNPANANKYYNEQMREVAEEELNTAIKLARQYGNAEEAFKSGYLPWSDREKEISQELEKNLGHGIYGRDANQMLVEAFDKRKDSIDSDIRGIVEQIIKKEVERAKKQVGIDLAPKKLGTKVFEHSIEPLSKDEYYAAIAEYKRKKA